MSADRAPRIATANDFASGQALPIGRTCGDCWGFTHGDCGRLRGVTAVDEVCVFEPRQFRLPASAPGSMGLYVSLGERLKGAGRG